MRGSDSRLQTWHQLRGTIPPAFKRANQLYVPSNKRNIFGKNAVIGMGYRRAGTNEETSIEEGSFDQIEGGEETGAAGKAS